MEVTDLNSIISEYLIKKGYITTNNSFLKELTSTKTHSSSDNELLFQFDRGNKTAFFKLWNQLVNAKGNSIITQKLEFYFRVYFGIFPIHPLNPECGNQKLLETEMQEFKDFLETKGSQLSKTPEFLSYYALPFVKDLQVFLFDNIATSFIRFIIYNRMG